MAGSPRYSVKIGSPCIEDWPRMAGRARERYSKACGQHTHNVATMTTAEIERLVAKSNGRLCGRVQHVPDRPLVTADLITIDSGWKGIGS